MTMENYDPIAQKVDEYGNKYTVTKYNPHESNSVPYRKESGYVYEVRDETDFEFNYPLGIFLSFDEAQKAIEANKSRDQPISWHQDGNELEIITIIKIPLGMSSEYSNWKTVFTLRRSEKYDKETDSLIWSVDD